MLRAALAGSHGANHLARDVRKRTASYGADVTRHAISWYCCRAGFAEDTPSCQVENQRDIWWEAIATIGCLTVHATIMNDRYSS